MKDYSYLKYGEKEWPVDELNLKKINSGQISPNDALRLENINDMLNPGYLPEETGWCILENGAGYISVLHDMPGVTAEMFAWWFGWHPLEDNRYKIWHPKAHYWARVSDADKAIICDPNTSLMDRVYGKVHAVSEDLAGIGEEPPYFNLHFRNPEEFGFVSEKLCAPNVACIICAFPDMGKDKCARDFPSTMIHFVRNTEDGIEVRTRFWLGYTIVDKKPICMIPQGMQMPIVAVYKLACHCVEEYSYLKSFLPMLYEEQKDLPLL